MFCWRILSLANEERCVHREQVFYKTSFRMEVLIISVTSKLTAQNCSGK